MASGSDIPQAWLDRIKELLGGEVFTAENPGKWEGKQGTHVPKVEKSDDGSYTIKVPHVMKKADNPEEDHWIEYVFVVDSSGNVAAAGKFSPTDDEAKIRFDGSGGKFVPYGFCNLHGLWKGAEF